MYTMSILHIHPNIGPKLDVLASAQRIKPRGLRRPFYSILNLYAALDVVVNV